MKRSKAYFITEAVEAFVDSTAWQVDHINRHSGAPGIPQEEVMEWMDSWGTGHELPMPTSKTS